MLSSITENHRTQTAYDDALIIKLFAFQFANSYASCFYIAFFRGVSTIYSMLFYDKIIKVLLIGAKGCKDDKIWTNMIYSV